MHAVQGRTGRAAAARSSASSGWHIAVNTTSRVASRKAAAITPTHERLARPAHLRSGARLRRGPDGVAGAACSLRLRLACAAHQGV